MEVVFHCFSDVLSVYSLFRCAAGRWDSSLPASLLALVRPGKQEIRLHRSTILNRLSVDLC